MSGNGVTKRKRLGSGVNYDQLILQELDSLDHLKSPKALRDSTILAIAEGVNAGLPITRILKREGVVSHRTFYTPTKDWYHNEEFNAVLKKVTDLVYKREREEIGIAEREARIDRHKRRVIMLDAGWRQLKQLMIKMNTDNASPAQVIKFFQILVQIEREEFGETLQQNEPENGHLPTDGLFKEEIRRTFVPADALDEEETLEEIMNWVNLRTTVIDHDTGDIEFDNG